MIEYSKLAGAGGSSEITNPIFEDSPLKALLHSPNPTDLFAVLLPNLISLAFIIGSIIFFFILIMGAIQWISSGGDKGAVETARGKITSALVGIVLLFSSFALIKIVEGFFGVHILTIDIGPLVIQ